MSKNENAIKAHGYYLKGKSLVEIAKIMDVSAATVRSWKARGKWDSLDATLAKKVQRVAKSRNPDAAADKAMLADIAENPALNGKESAFCLHYARTYNGAAAVRRAGYNTTENAAGIAYTLLQKPKIRDEIKRLKTLRNASILACAEDVVERYMQIAFADLTDYIAWGRVKVDVMGPFGPIEIDGKVLTREVNELRFMESDSVDGTLLSEVKQGKDGASVKLSDRMKALDWLSKYFELNPADAHRREYDRRRLALEALRTQTATTADESQSGAPDDGFLQALGAQAGGLWADGGDAPPGSADDEDEGGTKA
ncbi:MAG: terminase small subunit [Ruthenibacterium sp.]